MKTVQDDLRHCQITIEFAMNELMAGRTFYEDYFKDQKWEDLSRTDKAICILQSYMGNQELGDPEGFGRIRQQIHEEFLKQKRQKEKELHEDLEERIKE